MLFTANGKKWGNLDLNQGPAGFESAVKPQLSVPMGVGQPWQAAGLRRNRFHNRPGWQDYRCLSLL